MPGGDHVNPATPSVKLTYDDFVLFPDDGKRHELIDGEHYVTPAPNLTHQRIVGNLYLLIGVYLEAQPVGEVFMAPLDVILSRHDVVEPDLLFVTTGRRSQLVSGKWVEGPPDLAVEIGSPSTRKRDETIKRRLYERWGIGEYWVVDPEVQTVRVFRLRDGRYERPVELSREADDVLRSALLPGLDMPLARIFRGDGSTPS